MDDQAAMGRVHGATHRGEESQAILDRQLPGVAVLGDRLAPNQLHDEIRPSLPAHPAIEQPGDARMRQTGEDLALAEKPGLDLIRIHAALDELEGDLLLELSVRPFGQPHRPHAAPTQLLDQAVRSDQGAGGLTASGFLAQVGEKRRGKRARGPLEEIRIDRIPPAIPGAGHVSASSR